MRLSSALISAAVVLSLVILSQLPVGQAQPISDGTAQYLPAVFKAPPTPTATPIPPLLTNGDFEQGPIGWILTGGAYIGPRVPAHTGKNAAGIGGAVKSGGALETMAQRMLIPTDAPFLGYWMRSLSSQPDCARDYALIVIDPDPTDSVAAEPVMQFTNLCISQQQLEYVFLRLDLRKYAGQVVTLRVEVYTSGIEYSALILDDLSFQAENAPLPTATPTVTPLPTRNPVQCAPEYPTRCIPPPPPDLDCSDIPYRNFAVRSPDRHNFDTDKDGVGCESP